MRRIWILAVCVSLLCAHTPARAQESCPREVGERLPPRPPDAMPGSVFARRVASMTESERDEAMRTELLAGNIPAFVRNLVPVVFHATLGDGRTAQVTVCVLSDYLAIGSDGDFLLAPMRLRTALAVASRYGFTLPTARLVDAIYAQAAVHLSPQPLPASDQMRSTAYYLQHNELVKAQRAARGAALGPLTAGHMKDLVLTGRLWHFRDRVAIYGWHRAAEDPIQPLSTVHGANYADYSHGVRLVDSTILVDGVPVSIFDALEDPYLSRALNGEGPIPNLHQLLDVLAQPPLSTAFLLEAPAR